MASSLSKGTGDGDWQRYKVKPSKQQLKQCIFAGHRCDEEDRFNVASFIAGSTGRFFEEMQADSEEGRPR